MKRTIFVTALGVRIVARINTDGQYLAEHETARVRDTLADRLQAAASELPYLGTPRNRVKVA